MRLVATVSLTLVHSTASVALTVADISAVGSVNLYTASHGDYFTEAVKYLLTVALASYTGAEGVVRSWYTLHAHTCN